DPQVGRFASRDSMLDQIPYAYCGGEPNDFVDPSGRGLVWSLLKRLGAESTPVNPDIADGGTGLGPIGLGLGEAGQHLGLPWLGDIGQIVGGAGWIVVGIGLLGPEVTVPAMLIIGAIALFGGGDQVAHGIAALRRDL
ncbi:MAG: hypothetical protein KGK12_14835, partial [Armatimonadetes bacterium]|nr:hypothetical protein [Armatimonadota bacterium]